MAVDEVDTDWVMVDAHINQPKPSLFQVCKTNGCMLWKYYKRAMMMYRVYKAVRLFVHIYVLYHTLTLGRTVPF
jgi:hypothetical protein